jgi:hypothetical protein
MKERQLTRFIQDENPEIFQLDEKGIASYEKAKKDILFLMHTIDEWAKNKTLEVGQKNMYCGLMETYIRDYTKSLGYTGELEAAAQQRHSEIRGLNKENRELRRMLGEKVSLEDVREKIKNIDNQFKEWWNRKGFGHQNNSRVTPSGFYCEISGLVFGSHYDEDDMNDEEKVVYLSNLGFVVDDRHVTMSDSNLCILKKLLTDKFPSCEFFNCETTYYGGSWVIKDVTIRIQDLNDFAQDKIREVKTEKK